MGNVIQMMLFWRNHHSGKMRLVIGLVNIAYTEVMGMLMKVRLGTIPTIITKALSLGMLLETSIDNGTCSCTLHKQTKCVRKIHWLLEMVYVVPMAILRFLKLTNPPQRAVRIQNSKEILRDHMALCHIPTQN